MHTLNLSGRLQAVARAADSHGIDAVLVTPGPDLRYLVGYDAVPLERLTCLVIPSAGSPTLVVPALEHPAALASPAAELGVEILTWGETHDPYAIVGDLIPRAGRVALDDHMAARQVLKLRDALPAAQQVLATNILGELRIRKSEAEVDALARAGAAIDRVHAQVGALLRPGRTEREVGRDIAELIIAEGHVRVDFVIVASGPNSASPHHEVSDRILALGDVVVVDIGGTMPDGYCSDETRTYCLGEPPAGFKESYAVLMSAQAAASSAVRPGMTCEQIDAVARDELTAAGLGDLFIHRIGHGIGLDTHEEPYLVAGNDRELAPGMAFSIEPGFYAAGEFGARIEDIVVCTESGVRVLNHRPRDLQVVGV